MLSSSIINKKKQRKVRDDDDNDSNNDDLNEDFVPLVPAARAASPSLRATKNHLHYDSKMNKKPVRKQVEMTVFRQKHKEHVVYNDENDDADDDENYYRSSSSWSSWWSMCWGNTWRLFASCVLAMLLIVPLAKRRYKQQSHSSNSNNVNPKQSSNDITSWPSDDLVCAKSTYQMNFSQLYHQVAHYESESPSLCIYPSTTKRCPCLNPTLPNPVYSGREGQDFQWNLTFDRNLYLVQQQQAAAAATNKKRKPQPLDVLLLGDSITERWLGTNLLHPLRHENSDEYTQLFDELFTTKTTPRTPTTTTSQTDDTDNNDKKNKKQKKKKSNNDEANKNKETPSLQGMALGIAGDRCPQLLYRLQNGELNFSPPPKVFWVLIGINDFLSGDCAKETVLVGLMRIIHEIQQHLQQQHRRRQEQTSSSPSSWIVMNSILPAGRLATNRWSQDMWEWIQWVNHRLECYIQGLDHVEFFNATDLFLIPNPNKTNEENNNDDVPSMIIDKSLMHDFLHPSPRGQRLWGEAIVKKVLELTKATASP